ncbi:MAG: EAL domain-containing protein [Pseudomonadota bacterium]
MQLKLTPLRFTALYALIAGIWIFATDLLVAAVSPDVAQLAAYQTVKGLAFVATTAVFLYALLHRAWQSQAVVAGAPPAADEPRWRLGPEVPLVAFLSVVFAIGGTGAYLFNYFSDALARDARRDLEEISAQKAAHVDLWRRERLVDVRVVADSPLLAAAVAALAARPTDAHQGTVVERLQALQRAAGYTDVRIVDAEGRTIAATSPSAPGVPGLRAAADEALRRGGPVISDLTRAADGVTLVHVAAPLGRGGDDAPAPFALVATMDVRPFLVPLLADLPRGSRSTEMLVLRRGPDGLQLLTPVRHGAVPGPRPPPEAAQLFHRAADVREGYVEGLDHRGLPSMGYVRPVAGTQALLLVKTDRSEVHETIDQLRNATLGLVTLLMAFVALVMMLWWRNHAAWAAADAYRGELRRRTLERRLDVLAKYANDAILLLDRRGRILEANDQAVTAYGYPLETLRTMTISQLRAPGVEAQVRPHLDALERTGSAVFETVHRRRDGRQFPVESSSRRLELDGRVYIQTVIRDATERKRAEEELRRAQRQLERLNCLYAALTATNSAIVHARSEDELLNQVCRAAVDAGKLALAWIGRPAAGGRYLIPVVKAGAATEYLSQITVAVAPDAPEGGGLMGTCFRDTVHVIANDFLADPRTAPWHAAARRHGLRAAGAFPIRRAGNSYAVLAVYADEAGYFDDALVDLLDQMSADISFALDNLDRERARREAEERLALIIDAAPVAIVTIDPGGTVLTWNRGAEHIFGWRAEEVAGGPLPIVPEERTPEHRALRDRVAAGETFTGADLRCRTRTSALLDVSVSAAPIRDAAGRVTAVLSILEDISERKRAEERMKLWTKVLESSAEGIVVTGADGCIVTINQAFTNITGYGAQEAIGRTMRILRSGRHDADFYEALWRRLLADGHWQGEIWNRRRSGEIFPQWISITAVHDDSQRVTHYVGMFSDITEHKATEERIRHLAHFDALTNLPNRLLLAERFEAAVQLTGGDGRYIGCLFIDLDRFKDVNDSFGHEAGDAMLREMARRLERCVRATDTIARMGGDEFIVLLPGLRGPADAEAVVRKFVDALREPFVVADQALVVTASIGITFYPDDGRDLGTLIKHADIAMYAAKDAGRNSHEFFRADMVTHASEGLSLEGRLRRALERDEFILHYQPLVAAADGRIVGFEALVRWQDPESGMVPPDRFIPVAEERGLIVPIGTWVLRAACAQMRQWQASGLPAVPIAVNLSALQFQRSDFVHTVRRALEESGLDPGLLELELTESIIMRGAEGAIDTLNRLRELGIHLSIDDFGTGYSSLNYLRRFPLDKLKIDKSFVRDMMDNVSAANIVTAIIGLARSLKLEVIAEGVETPAQCRALRRLGCGQLQGYLFGRPQPAEAARAVLARGGSLLPRDGGEDGA